MKGAVTFYFGPGSRYSYLASTQLPRISEETGARFIWRAVYSPELIASAGSDPFQAANRRGQYRPPLKTSRDGLLSMASRIPSLTGIA
jgi:2-hydroxychromene-2-carboxylate isomerase